MVDASVIPAVTNANLNAPVMMLAEKAAEEILNFYKLTDLTESTSTISIDYEGSTTAPEGNGSKSTLIDRQKLLINSSLSLIMLLFLQYFTK